MNKKLLINIVTVLSIIAFNLHAEKLKIDDVMLDYEIVGEGEPLLLLHGGGGSKESMQGFTNFFKDSYQVISIDSREQGYSSLSAKPLSYELMVNDTFALINHLNLKKVNIIGYSDGAIIGLMIAMQNPEVVQKLSAIAANYHWNISEQFVKEMNDMKNEMLSIPIEKMPESYRERFIKWGKEPKDAYGLFRELFDMWLSSPEIPLESFKNIEANVLYLVGDRDAITVEHTTDMYRATPRAQLFILPNATHSVIAERPKMINEAIKVFLEQNN